ncbi:MAG: metal ABC transporter permease [Gemmatimonadales bacterium]
MQPGRHAARPAGRLRHRRGRLSSECLLPAGWLIIIPAATAKHRAGSLRSMKLFAVAIAMLATLLGAPLAPRLHLAAGRLTITIAAAIFGLSLARGRVG